MPIGMYVSPVVRARYLLFTGLFTTYPSHLLPFLFPLFDVSELQEHIEKNAAAAKIEAATYLIVFFMSYIFPSSL